MAAGLSLEQEAFHAFAKVFNAEVERRIEGMDSAHSVHSDGELSAEELRLEVRIPLTRWAWWGQGFPEPLFDGEFEVVQARVVGEKHLKLVLRTPDQMRVIDAIVFFVDNPESWLGQTRLDLSPWPYATQEGFNFDDAGDAGSVIVRDGAYGD